MMIAFRFGFKLCAVFVCVLWRTLTGYSFPSGGWCVDFCCNGLSWYTVA